jgi:hypothetical protein
MGPLDREPRLAEKEDLDQVEVGRAVIQFRDHFARFRTLPLLFAGSGVSRRYLNAPDWETLLEVFARKLDRELPYYRGKTTAGLPGVASEIARDFYELWWNSEEYEDSRLEFQDSVHVYSDPLKIEVAKHVASFSKEGIDDSLQRELGVLSQAKFHAIISTNWDRLLEQLFPEFTVFTGQREILFSETQGVGEIYKIHGSIDDPTSLVLTAEDYAQFEGDNPYIVAKLLTSFVEHPVVFIGYGLNDPHIRVILTRLLGCMAAENVQKLNDRLVFVRPGGGEEFKYAPMILEGHNINVIECVAPSFGSLYEILADLPRRFPVKLLRQLKQEVYELALKEPPVGRIHVVDIDDDTQLDQVDVVIGVGALARLGAKGYQVFGRQDLVMAMLNEDRSLDVEKLFAHVIPRVFQQAKFTPIHYALALDEAQGGDRAKRLANLPVRARALATGLVSLEPYFSTLGVAGRPFRDVVNEDPMRALRAGLACSFDEESDIEALRSFLLDRFQRSALPSTELYKLACKYDALKYS